MDSAQFAAKYGSNPTVYRVDFNRQRIDTLNFQFNNAVDAFEFVRGLQVATMIHYDPNYLVSKVVFVLERPRSFELPSTPELLANPLTFIGPEDEPDYEQMTDSERTKLFRFVIRKRINSGQFNSLRNQIQQWLKEKDSNLKVILVWSSYGRFKSNKSTTYVSDYQVRVLNNNSDDPRPNEEDPQWLNNTNGYDESIKQWKSRNKFPKTDDEIYLPWFFDNVQFLNGLLSGLHNTGRDYEGYRDPTMGKVFDKDRFYKLEELKSI